VPHDRDKIPEHHAAEVGRFYETHSKWLYGHAYLRLGQDSGLATRPQLAQDLVQDVFEAAAVSWSQLRLLNEPQQKRWLLTVLSRMDASQFRRQLSLRRKLPKLYDRYQPVTPDVEREALSRIALKIAMEIIEGLPGKQKKIALMRWTEQMRSSEIAAELGCSENSVAVQVTHIRQKLIDGLGAYYPFGDEHRKGRKIP
jgi:RNA polymerase sigma factor (sigma-70 family)